MHCTIAREHLLEPLQSVAGVVETRQTVPILSHVLLTLSDEALTMQCTDNEIAIISNATPIEVIQPGTTTVSAYMLLEIVRRLPKDAPITLRQETNQVKVHSGNSHFCLMSLSPESFPSVALEATTATITVSEKFLYQAIKTTQFAMAHNNPRYYLNGMLWDIQPNQLQVVATDAHRLAERHIAAESSASASLIVPRKTVTELARLLVEGSEQSIEIGFTDNQLFLKSSSYQLTSRLIAGAFPDYKKLLPQETSRCAVIDRNLFKEALSKLMPLVKQEIHKGVRLNFSKNALKLSVSNSKQETGEESVAISYERDKDENFSIAFNIDYLDKILDVLPQKEVRLVLPIQEGVTLLEQYHGAKDHFYLIMPILL